MPVSVFSTGIVSHDRLPVFGRHDDFKNGFDVGTGRFPAILFLLPVEVGKSQFEILGLTDCHGVFQFLIPDGIRTGGDAYDQIASCVLQKMPSSPDGFIIGMSDDHQLFRPVEVDGIEQFGDRLFELFHAQVRFFVSHMPVDKENGQNETCQKDCGNKQHDHFSFRTGISGSHWKSICRHRLVRRVMASSGFMAA